MRRTKVVGAMLAPILIAVAPGGAAGITTDGITNSVFAQEQKFTATLSAQEEVPPTNSQATGISESTAAGGGIEYAIDASNIQGVTAGHIHSGKQGENGPVIVTLLKDESPANEVSETGSITADKLEGSMAGQQLSDLVTAMSNGETYVNIHRTDVRGQI